MEEKIALFWFRRDLRLHDNHALFAALSSGMKVLPLFIFDSEILGKLPARRDTRLQFIHREVNRLSRELQQLGSSLVVLHGTPFDAFRQLIVDYPGTATVYTNIDYEPDAVRRDSEVSGFLAGKGIALHGYKDHVIFGKNEVLKSDGMPYTVYTPYSRKWKERLAGQGIPAYPSESLTGRLLNLPPQPVPALEDLGFESFRFDYPSAGVNNELLEHYGEKRDIPAVNGTSHLGIHLRFGTISVRELTAQALKISGVFLGELIWRDFFIQIMANFPHVVNSPFKKQYEAIPWRNHEGEFEKWCRGETGYPMVDAGMRELNQTGFMHNRVRMITASFLTKHLLIDWRWGEAWFAEKLLDYELASNNGNWQWAAGTGCDAAPYFRVFNPEIQQQKFDPAGEYIRKWVPEAGTISYARPLVEHAFARDRAIAVYKKGLEG